MKNRIIKNGIAMLALTLCLGACSDDFLEVDPKGTFLEDNYYKNEQQAYTGLVATYDVLRKQSGGFENMMAMLNAGSDDFYAGGGSSTDGIGIQSFSNFTITPTFMPGSFWSDYYKGVFRANVLLQKLPNVPMSDENKARFAAEAKALRGYYYFQLVTMFGEIPFYTTNLRVDQFYTIEKTAPSVVYEQIEKDLLEAIEVLPVTVGETESARFTKGAAKAILGKVYLFEGKKAEAAAQFAEVNGTPGETSAYGYRLLPNFNDLWVVDNKYHSESIFVCAHSKMGNSTWGNYASDSDEGNTFNLMIGPRGYTAGPNAPKYRTGWSFNTVTPDLYAAMLNDPRRDATIANIGALKDQGLANYSPANMDTGLFLKKFMPTADDVTDGGGEQDLNYRQNTYIVRLADTYLMEAEALNFTGARAQALLDAVRRRVGLPSVPVSKENVMNERRLELAGEGHRFWDLVRNDMAAAKLGSRGFIKGKHEYFPVPIGETQNTMIKQNPAYN